MVYAILNVDETRETFILVVIEPENLERMKKADPATLESIYRGGILEAPRYPERLSIMIAYEDDVELYKRLMAGGRMEFLAWLERGRKFIEGIDGKEQIFKVQM